MNKPLLSEEHKAKVAERQLKGDGPSKAFYEFCLQDYQDHVARIFRTCRDMGLTPADVVAGYIEAFTTMIATHLPQPTPEQRPMANKIVGLLVTKHLNILNKEH